MKKSNEKCLNILDDACKSIDDRSVGEYCFKYLKKGRKPLNERLGILLYKSVCRKKRKAKFITIVREPVSRNFSAFFQNFKRFTGSDFKESKLYKTP